MNNRQIRILIWGIANAKGGITQYVLNHWNYIDKSKFAVDFVTIEQNLDFCETLTTAGCTIHSLPRNFSFKKNYIPSKIAVSKIYSNNYDIIYFNMSNLCDLTLLRMAHKSGSKVIVHSHTTKVEDFSLFRRGVITFLHYLNRISIKRYSDIRLACSTLAGNWLFGKSTDFTVIPNGVDLERFKYNDETRVRFRNEMSINGECLSLCHIGRFTYAKNHEFLIGVFENLLQKQKNAKLFLIGKGIHETEILASIRRKGLEDSVFMLGARSDIPNLLQAMDVFLLPSFFEGFPIVAVEAQAAGLPCLLSDTITAEASIVKELVSFLPIDSGYDLWVDKILKQISNRNLRRNTLNDGDLPNFDISNTTMMLEKKYMSLMERK